MNEIQLAVSKIKPFVSLDDEAMRALELLETEANKSFQATSKQTWAINNHCTKNDKEITDFIAESGVAVHNHLRISKTEASALIKFMNK